MSARSVTKTVAAALMAILTPAMAYAQASITGVVRDTSGAVLPVTRFNRRARLAGLAILLAGMMAADVSGHHGTAVSYDGLKEVTITGTVTEFWWRNPHSALFLDVTDDKGERVSWAIELGSPGTLMRGGWTRRTFVAGDTVTIIINPSRAGTPVGVCDGPCKATVNGKDVSRREQP